MKYSFLRITTRKEDNVKKNRKTLIATVLVVGVLSAILFLSGTGVAQGDMWTPTGSMAEARRDHTATLLANGNVLIVGFNTEAELYDPVTGTFSLAVDMLFNHGQGSTATQLLDGRVLIVGGTGAQTFAEIYDPATGTFSQTGSLNAVHSYHTATLLPDGRVLIAAGQNNVGPQTHAVAELYDSLTGTFSPTGSLNEHRSLHTATLLSDGQVLITGGNQTTTPGYGISLDSAEFYDPTTGIFSVTGSMEKARTNHTATLLPNGRVLVAGDLIANLAELYDPATGTFSSTGDMSKPRNAHTATLLPNGQVLLAGGYVAVGPITTNSAELYDPITGTFSATDNMTTARQQYTATLLYSGRVLVTGGYNGSTNTSSAELFSGIPSPVELAHDDSTCEIYPMIHDSQYLRQRFLVSNFGLSGDYLVKTVRMYWRATPEDFAGEIKLHDYDTGEVVTAVSFTQPVSGWHDYDVSGLGFVSDHFYVELWQTSGFGYICGDTDPPHHSMSEVSMDHGETWHLFNYPETGLHEIDFMIRVIVVLPPREQIANTLDFFDTSVDEGTLVGVGPGNSAEKRLMAIRNMIEAAGDLIGDGLFAEACQQLMDAYSKTDGLGDPPDSPPDFVEGEAAPELAGMILELMETLECQ